MIRHALIRALPCFALLVPVLAGCKFETTVVGDDDAGVATDSGHAKGQDAGCIALPCAEPMIPVGCTMSVSTCVDGKYTCPEPVCPDGGSAIDAGSGCTPAPCAEPEIPAGCTLGNASCVDGEFVCPPVVCPDAGTAGSACKAAGGTCTGTGSATCAKQASDADQDCNPDRNPGGSFCCLDTTTTDAGKCVDIAVSSYDVSCTQASDCISIYAGELCDGDCACPNATVSASEQSKYDQAINGIITGLCGCPAFFPPECLSGKCVLSGPGQGVDSGTPFACGTSTTTCDPATQYCYIVEGGPVSPDGGSAYNATCKTIPSQCASDGPIVEAVCACIAAAESLQPSACTYDGSGDMTVTLEAP